MQYLVAIHHPDGYDPSTAKDENMRRNIDALNDEMVAAGIRVLSLGCILCGKRSRLGGALTVMSLSPLGHL